MDSAPHSSRSNPDNIGKKTSKPDELQIPKGDNSKDLKNSKGSVSSDNICESNNTSCELSSVKLPPADHDKTVVKESQRDQENDSINPQSVQETVEPPEGKGTKRDSSVLSEESPMKTTVVQKNKKRCFKCSCKLELAQREIGRCRCGLVFCPLHRLPELHNCDFDHKEDGREKAREKMVKPTRHLGTSFRRLDTDS